MLSSNFGRYESLHNHTVISDGAQTHQEVLKAAEKNGFGLISFTDHDILPRENDIRILQSFNSLVKWNIGIEISSNLPVELGSRAATLFHILGLDIDYTDKALREYCEHAEAARLERLTKTVSNLRQLGFDISLDRCLEIAGEGSAGSRHISRALLENDTNITKFEALAYELKQKSADDENMAHNFARLMQKVNSGTGHPYVRELLLSDDAYISGVYVPYTFGLAMDETVELIRNAGGVAVIAHWPTVKHVLTSDHLEKIAAEKRVDGLELRSVYNVDPEEVSKNQTYIQNVIGKYGLLGTFGVDGHDKSDFTDFIQNINDPSSTIGQWQKITNFNL